MASNLLIVESPAKAKTIEKILGEDFVVKSCYGHIRDLPKNKIGLDLEGDFAPVYEVSEDKKAIVAELKKLSKKAEVWLATDEDREGEAISWHLCEVLGLDAQTTKRIVFNEITDTAIKKAVAHPRRLDLNLVNAQQARRAVDRIVGFELSPILWQKLSNRNLSAGRVQSVAVRLVVEREREIQNFNSISVFRVVAVFKVEKKIFKAELNKRFNTENEAQSFLNACIQSNFTVSDIQVKAVSKSPAAPFTTSTLQQEASRKLSFSVSKTMSVAQKLYESGKITYMRTDSTSLSEQARHAAADFIKTTYGSEFSHPTQYQTKSSTAQEAHEAIRPTYFDAESVGGTRDEQRLYELIWKRTIASQMSKAQLEKTLVKIDVLNREEIFVAEGEVVVFPGFLKVYLESTDDDESTEVSGMLPALSVSQQLSYAQIEARQKYSQAPARFTEASLVKRLEELGIGRPSTYAPTISTITQRGYVKKETKEGQPRDIISFSLKANESIINRQIVQETTGSLKGKMVPTDIGMLVNDYLTEHFERVLDYNFTANIEKEFDRIAEDKLDWVKVMKEFYTPFHEEVKISSAQKERVTGERNLGTDPETGKPVIARIGRYGPMIQIGSSEDEDKPKFAGLLEGQSIHSITFEEAMELFKLPRVVGSFEGKVIKANTGRFGPYVQHDKLFVSLKNHTPFSIDEASAIELIVAKRESDANKVIQVFEDGIEVLNGRFGPYIKKGKENYKIPKGMNAQSLTVEDCKKIINDTPEKKPLKKKKN
ncbi:MAG: type I DNA topoisomerase [Chitinophagales bacterium]|nr:type I DNA topoisomerase [Chitinophagales bacterium]MCZ2392393.1 type I DNA topoisomerase [Chitinophagales bacterium]